jgi:hypothetical protein
MHGLAAEGPERILRRLAACVLIFALLLQGVTLAVGAARLSASAAGDTAWAGFELCHHDGGNTALPGSPPEEPAAGVHCVFCLAAAGYVLVPPDYAPEFRPVIVAIVAGPFEIWRLPVTTVDASARPRGPPLAA